MSILFYTELYAGRMEYIALHYDINKVFYLCNYAIQI